MGDFAVPHDGVAVSHVQERAPDLNRQIERCAGTEFLHVHVAAIVIGVAVGLGFAGRGRTDGADHRPEGEREPGAPENPLLRNLHRVGYGTPVLRLRQNPADQRRPPSGKAGIAQLSRGNVQNFNNQGVSRFGAFHPDYRTEIRPSALRRAPAVPSSVQPVAALQLGLNAHGLAGSDPSRRGMRPVHGVVYPVACDQLHKADESACAVR